MLSAFVSDWCSFRNHKKPPRSVLRHRVKNAVKKCSKAIKKQAKNLHKRKTCAIFVSNKRTKDPAIRGMI